MRPLSLLHTFLPHLPPPFLWNEKTVIDEESVSTSTEPPAAEDFLHFGREWPTILPHLEKDLDSLITQQRATIQLQKENWRQKIEQEKEGNAKPFYEEFEDVLATGAMKPNKFGGGGVYILYDVLGEARFVIKPNDEAILCLNNPKQRGSPFNDPSHRLRDHIPLYKTCETESAVSAIAGEVGIGHCTPETHMMIITSSLFYDLTSHLDGIEKEKFISRCGPPDQEKLCSIQRFIPDSIDLHLAMHEWFEAGLENLYPLPIAQEEFEDVLLLLWLTYDADGHSSNFRLFFKGLDEHQQAVYGITKIDNGLTLPEENRYLLNYLGYFPNAKSSPSNNILEKISSLDEDRLCQILDQYHLFSAKNALMERIDVLKTLSLRTSITLEEINHRFELLSLPNGKDLALSLLSIEELMNFVQKDSDQHTTPMTSSRCKNRSRLPSGLVLLKA